VQAARQRRQHAVELDAEAAELEGRLLGVDGVDGGLLLAIRNRGGGPGVLRRVTIESGIAPTLPAPGRTEIPAGELPERIAIAGGAAHRATHALPPLTAAERAQLQGGAAVFFVRGVVVYEDASGARHQTTFCRVLEGEHDLVAPARPGENYGD
jgi:hypothetical protein